MATGFHRNFDHLTIASLRFRDAVDPRRPAKWQVQAGTAPRNLHFPAADVNSHSTSSTLADRAALGFTMPIVPKQTLDHAPTTKTPPANLLWFQNSLVTIRVSTSDCQEGLSILEHFAPRGFSPPLLQ